MEYKSAVFRNTIRATFAITVATIIAYFIPYKNSWWIQLTAILLMQVSFGASIKRSKGIIIGTIFGVLSGVLFAALSQTYSYLLIIIPLSVFLGSYMLAFFYSGAIFMFSILIIMLLSLHDKMSIDLWHFALVRLLDITIGIAIVISTSLFLFPAWAKDDFRENLAEGIKVCQNYFGEIIKKILEKNEKAPRAINRLIDIENLLQKTRKHFDDYSYEPGTTVVSDGSAYAIIISQERMHSILSSLQVIQKNCAEIDMDRKLEKLLENILLSTKDIVKKLVSAIKTRTHLPDFAQLDKLFKETEISDVSPAVSLLYHNLYAYISTLKHINQAIKQLRNEFSTSPKKPILE